MEKELSLTSFFNLKECPYIELFKECHFSWDALNRLILFLKNQKLGKIETSVPSSVFLDFPELISIGKGTVIEPGSYIRGPCIIGKDCEIRHGAYIRGNVVVGNQCIIGHDTEIKHSILLNGVCAGHFNYIGDSILGNRVNLGAGVKCANLRLDHSSVSVLFRGEKIQTNLLKLGAIIGDDAKLGCNAVTNPGTLIGKEAFCHPCLNVGGYIPARAVVKSTQKILIQENIYADSH